MTFSTQPRHLMLRMPGLHGHARQQIATYRSYIEASQIEEQIKLPAQRRALLNKSNPLFNP